VSTLLADVLGRLAEARDVLTDSPGFAAELLRDLEHDLGRLGERWPRCPDCGARAPSDELLDRHRLRRCFGGGA
jgi:hypothetical protein